MTGITFRALQAENGDAFILLTPEATILIDGGPNGVYRNCLRSHLVNLPKRGETEPQIDLAMVSHIDDDHVVGIKELVSELSSAQTAGLSQIVSIKQVWHNSFSDDLVKTESKENETVEQASLAETSFSSFRDLVYEDEGTAVLAGVRSGRDLRLDLEAVLHIPQNDGFENGIVLRKTKPVTISDVRMHVIGPTEVELEKLRKKWLKELPKILAKESGAKLAAASLDRSISNLASIVAVVHVGKKRILLTGDARTDMVETWLKETGYLEDEKVHFEIAKVSHHASLRSNTSTFYEKVTADHYVISGDGGHGNPDPGVLEMIVNSRADQNYQIHLTYPFEEIKDHDYYKKKKKDDLLDQFIAAYPNHQGVFVFPKAGSDYIDISI